MVIKTRTYIGSSLDDFLKEEGIFEEAEAYAREKIEAVKLERDSANARANTISTARIYGSAIRRSHISRARAMHRLARRQTAATNRQHRNWSIKLDS